jgi:hypothetical protein
MSLPPSSSSSSFLLHLLQRVKNEEDEAPPSSSVVKDPSHVRTGQHLCFSISNFYSFLQTLKVLIFFITMALYLSTNIISFFILR